MKKIGDMEPKIEFIPSAFKHGVTEADIWSAFEKFICDGPLPDFENKYLLLGFDTKGNLLEIMYNYIHEDTVKVFHAMKCRRQFYENLGTRK
jgi:hypothetical protein